MPRRRGFIVLFGTRTIISNDRSQDPLETTCPQCGQQTWIVGKSARSWFTLFFIPVFPVSGAQVFSQCSACGAQFGATLNQIRQGLTRADQQQNQQAITLYNSLRASPANSITLNQLMLMYASMNEYGQAISAAREFPAALDASEQCMTTLARVYLAADQRDEAMKWFDAAIARNATLGEAHYYKAIAYLTQTPPNFDAAIAAARAARSANFPNADALLQDIQQKARGEQ